jgi:predicted nucleotidyltransferase
MPGPNLRLPAGVERGLDTFVTLLRERFGGRLIAVRLFGSYARGTAHEESDVDCLVLLDRVTPEDDRAITDVAGDLTWQADVVIAPLIMSVDQFEAWKASERRAALEIDREGVTL